MLNNNKLNIVLSIWVAFVFLQSLPFKFTGHEVTDHIFTTIGSWMAGIPILSIFSDVFSLYGGVLVGSVELIASLLLLAAIFRKYRRFRFAGAVIAFVVITGAIFFHLFTPLGIYVDGSVQLFIMAITVFIASLILMKNSCKKS